MPRRRRILLAFAILAIVAVLAVAVVFFAIRQAVPPRAPIMNVAEPVEPLTKEMECVEGVLNNNRLEANQVQAALDACR